MYLLDPRRGARRRHGLVDRVRSALGEIGDVADKAKRDAGNRMQGVAAHLHGSPPSRRTRSILARRTPERRILEGGGGAALAMYGLVRGGPIGTLLTVAGVSCVANAAVPRQAGMIRVQKTITINAPVEEVFAFWSRFENFPRFMEHVIDVRSDGKRSHWRVKGPGGLPITWEAELVDRIENKKIAWRSLEASVVEHHGEVHFEPIGDRATRISVHMAYRPPAGALGHTVAAFLMGDPKRLMNDDLLRLQALFTVPEPPRSSQSRNAPSGS
jgi:uncharacterized membrane protein